MPDHSNQVRNSAVEAKENINKIIDGELERISKDENLYDYRSEMDILKIDKETLSQDTKDFMRFLSFFSSLSELRERLHGYVRLGVEAVFAGDSEIINIPQPLGEAVKIIFNLEPENLSTPPIVLAQLINFFPHGITADAGYHFYNKNIPAEFEKRLDLVLQLKNYIEYIKDKGIVIGKERVDIYDACLDSFKLFKKSQANNRVSNGMLAQHLSRQLIYSGESIQTIFSQENIDKARNSLGQSFAFANSKSIHSERINWIIASAQEYSAGQSAASSSQYRR